MYSYCHNINIVKIGSTKLAHTTHIGKLKGDMSINDKLIGSTIMCEHSSLIYNAHIIIRLYSHAPPANEGSHLYRYSQ